jgi:hypothetical protein
MSLVSFERSWVIGKAEALDLCPPDVNQYHTIPFELNITITF